MSVCNADRGENCGHGMNLTPPASASAGERHFQKCSVTLGTGPCDCDDLIITFPPVRAAAREACRCLNGMPRFYVDAAEGWIECPLHYHDDCLCGHGLEWHSSFQPVGNCTRCQCQGFTDKNAAPPVRAAAREENSIGSAGSRCVCFWPMDCPVHPDPPPAHSGAEEVGDTVWLHCHGGIWRECVCAVHEFKGDDQLAEATLRRVEWRKP